MWCVTDCGSYLRLMGPTSAFLLSFLLSLCVCVFVIQPVVVYARRWCGFPSDIPDWKDRNNLV